MDVGADHVRTGNSVAPWAGPSRARRPAIRRRRERRRFRDRPRSAAWHRCRIMSFLPMPPRVFSTATSGFWTPSFAASPFSDRRLRHEGERGRGERPAVGAEHRPVMHRLRRRDRGVRIAHRRRGDGAALDDEIGLHAEEGRRPQHEIGELARPRPSRYASRRRARWPG